MPLRFVQGLTGREMAPIVRGARLQLRAPMLADFPAWSQLRGASRSFLQPWEPRWPDDDLERPAFRRRLRRYQDELRRGTGFAFYLIRLEDGALLGGVTLSNVRRGVIQSGSLGYWAGQPHAGQGYMSEALTLLKPFVFETLKLHRIEAACLPDNHVSIRLLRRAGFEHEGLARRYLKINGHWQDHLLFAILADNEKA